MLQQSTSSAIRVLVSDDTRFHTELLADALRRDGALQVTTSTSGSAGLTAFPHLHNVDVLLVSSTLDERPGHGFEVLRGLRSTHGDMAAVMLLDSSKRETILEAFASGARGVFGRHQSIETLGKCVRRVHEGQIWANSEQMAILVGAMASSQNVRAVDARGMSVLSKRELEIVRSVAQGLTNREIAKQLYLSPHTVKNCLFRIFDKLGVSNRVELLMMTIDHDRDTQSGYEHLLGNDGDFSLNEATLIGCQRGAERGVLMAQLALAQHYSACGRNSSDRCNSYVWYSVAMQRLSQAWKDIAQEMTVDQVVEAEQRAARWLELSEKNPVMGNEVASTRCWGSLEKVSSNRARD